LRVVHDEAVPRGYAFAAGKISRCRASGRLTVTRGQLAFEWHHLMEKLRTRDPKWRAQLSRVKQPQPHPLFRVCHGEVARWEKGVLERSTIAAAAPQRKQLAEKPVTKNR
jgi:hypothetical protein